MNYGFAPFLPLLSHFQHMIHQQSYEVWMEQDMTWVASCDCLLRLPGQSSGADREVERAKEVGIPVFFNKYDLYKHYNIKFINWENILKSYDKELDRETQKEGFFGYLDKIFFCNLHLSEWVNNHPGKSYMEMEFIKEYIQDRNAYVNKPDIGVSMLMYCDFKYGDKK
jgi:hypothetical protein